MNNRRFIELLNLYVDEQLDPKEAAELEAEVLANPARRRTYNQYCRLHRGCCLLSDGSRAIAPTSQAFARSLLQAERKISAPRRSSSWRPVYTGMFSAAAMAACVAVVVVVNRQSAPTSAPAVAEIESPASRTSQPEIAVAALPAAVVSAPTASSFDIQPALAAAGLGVVRNAREADIAANDREALEWMQRVELMPSARVVIDEQAFETRPTLQQDNRVFRSRHSIQGNAEFTAFQFQR